MLRSFRNYVWFCGEGGFPEKLLSEAAALGLTVTDSRKEGETLYAACPAGQYKRLRPLAKRACMRLHVVRKQGPYFRLFPYRKRVGMPIGLALAVILLCFLSGRIWVVQVDTALPVDEQAVLAAVAAQGVYPGCRIKDVDMQLLRLSALSELKEMVYVSVNPSGCVARVTVDPRSPKPSVENFHENFSNLIAARDGKILYTEIYSGQAAVRAGDGVTAGMLLVSGTVETPAGNTYLRRASGKIIAQTTRTLTVSVPLTETVTQQTDETVFHPYFRFLKWDIPLFSSIPLDDDYTVSTRALLPQVGDVMLPIGLIDRRYIRTRRVTVDHTAKEATALAKQRLSIQQGALQAQGVTVVAVACEDVTVSKNTVTLSTTLVCQEDIAVEKPLKFADNSTEKS